MRELGIFPWVALLLAVATWVRAPPEHAARRALVIRLVAYFALLAALLAAGSRALGGAAPLSRVLTIAALQLAVLYPVIELAHAVSGLVARRLHAVRAMPPWSARTLAMVVGQLGIFVVALPLVALSLSLRRANGAGSVPPRVFGRATAPVAFAGRDGTSLAGVWIAAPEHRGVALLVHGLAADKVMFLEAVGSLSARGYDVFSFDQRAHGDSGGHTTTLGAVEQDDVRAAWDVVLSRTRDRSRPRLAVGISLGGAALQLAAGDLRGLDGMLLDSTFARADVPARRHLPLPPALSRPLVAMARWMAVPLTGYAALDVAPVEAARQNAGSYPVELIHAVSDPLIPFSEAEALRDAYASRARLTAVEGDVHPVTFLDHRAYDAALARLATAAEARHASARSAP